MTEAIQATRIIMVGDTDPNEEITQVGFDAFVPSDEGETVALFLTSEQRDMVAKLLVLRSLTNENDKAFCQSIYAKLPPRASL
jgi:hypothetical protein